MRVLVTGANGQLGQDLVRVLSDRYSVVGFGREQLDVTSLERCKKIILSEKPDVVIHAAAHTAVDRAEEEPDEAYLVNAYGTRNVALAANEAGAKLCYISTDYVFDGTANRPYREYDSVNPRSVYGRSKRAGEELVLALSNKFFIVRTSWVFGARGSNFVKTILKLAAERDRLKVVHDQTGSPTYTVDLSRFLSDLIVTEQYGIYHASNTGVCSWYEFARAILEESGIDIPVDPCSTEEFPRPAPRPAYSVLDHMAIRLEWFSALPPWRDALKRFLIEMNERA